MKLRKTALLAGIITLCSTSLFADYNMPKQYLLQKYMTSVLNRNHYHKPEIDDAFSKKAFDLYIDRLDLYKRYFYQSDFENLRKYEDKIDDQIEKNEFELYVYASTLLEERMLETKEIVFTLLDSNLDLTVQDTLETDPDKLHFPKDYEEKKSYWEKILKWDIANRYLDIIEEEQGKDLSDDEKDEIEFDYLQDDTLNPEIQAKAVEKIKKKYTRIFRDLTELTEDQKLALYFNSFLNVYDPHTTWMPPADKEDFDLDMTGKMEGIGASLSEDDGYIKITSIVPGSPSWKQKILEPEDVILKVAQAEEEPVDIVEMPLRKVVKLIRGKKGTEVRLTIKKPTGEIIVVPIIRDVIVLEESYAKAALLEDKGSKETFSYIQLPKFYRDFRNPAGRNSTGDVKDAILEMTSKKDVKGLILDLRNNGGGALTDAVNMSGLFFKDGPVVQVKDQNEKVKVLEDTDSSVLFDKPLVVIVNSLSASASEILAGALQDYNRAVIIGANQTFGKGTVQTLYDLNRGLSRFQAGEYGSLKFTIQKFYRINGESTQFKGVVPNVIVPDSFDYRDIGEREYDYALPWDTIGTSYYAEWKNTTLIDLQDEKEIATRIQKNDKFQQVNETNERLRVKIEDKSYDLNIKRIIEERKIAKKEGAKARKKFKENENLIVEKVIYHPAEEEFDLSADEREAKEEQLADWKKRIQRDIYIDEAMNIIQDIID